MCLSPELLEPPISFSSYTFHPWRTCFHLQYCLQLPLLSMHSLNAVLQWVKRAEALGKCVLPLHCSEIAKSTEKLFTCCAGLFKAQLRALQLSPLGPGSHLCTRAQLLPSSTVMTAAGSGRLGAHMYFVPVITSVCCLTSNLLSPTA